MLVEIQTVRQSVNLAPDESQERQPGVMAQEIRIKMAGADPQSKKFSISSDRVTVMLTTPIRRLSPWNRRVFRTYWPH